MRLLPERRLILLALAGGVLAASSPASAAFHGLVADQYKIVENGQTYCVVDLYVDMDAGNTLSAVFGASIWLSGDAAWFHADSMSGGSVAGTWSPLPSASNPASDSFVTIGGLAAPYPDNATLLVPGFPDGGSGDLGGNAGCFNSNPNNFSGLAKDIVRHDGSILQSAVMIGRFSVVGVTSQPRAVIVEEASFQWSSTPFGTSETSVVFGGSFEYVPSPGAVLALVGGAPLLGRRSRRRSDCDR